MSAPRDERCVKVGDVQDVLDRLRRTSPLANVDRAAMDYDLERVIAQAHECDGGLRGAVREARAVADAQLVDTGSMRDNDYAAFDHIAGILRRALVEIVEGAVGDSTVSGSGHSPVSEPERAPSASRTALSDTREKE